MPIALEMRSDVLITAVVGHQLLTLVNNAKFKDGNFTGELNASLESKDTERFNYTLRLVLHPEGGRLYSGATALGDPKDQHFTAALTSWIDLTRPQ